MIEEAAAEINRAALLILSLTSAAVAPLEGEEARANRAAEAVAAANRAAVLAEAARAAVVAVARQTKTTAAAVAQQ